MKINPESFTFLGSVFMMDFSAENIPKEEEFWLELIFGRLYIHFFQSPVNPKRYLAFELEQGCFQHLYPIANLRDAESPTLESLATCLSIIKEYCKG